MPIDPRGKLAKLKRVQALQREKHGYRTGKRRRRGRLSRRERNVLTLAVAQAPAGILAPEQMSVLAREMGRAPGAIATVVRAAREHLQANAEKYVSIHLQAAERGLKEGDKGLEVARKASEFAIERISAADEKGETVRIVDVSQASAGPRVQIGIALGGLPARVTARED